MPLSMDEKNLYIPYGIVFTGVNNDLVRIYPLRERRLPMVGPVATFSGGMV